MFNSAAIEASERLEPEHVVQALQQQGRSAELYADANAIVKAITPQLREGDVVAILSNGGFGGIYDKLPAALASARQGVPELQAN